MKVRWATLVPLALTPILARPLAAQRPAAEQTCARLAALALPHTTVTSARVVAAGTVPNNPGEPPIALPARCVVRALAQPTPDSRITVEVWLPTAGWNGKYQQVGNSGWAGTMQTPSLAAALVRGYAVAGTDNGHEGGAGAEWAIGHPEKLIDFGSRALHETTVTAKSVIRAFYGREASRSYFLGCSDGGREALVMAQRFPEEFDGILAGAPANDWSHLMTSFVWNRQAQSAPGSAIPPAKLAAIQAASLAACDTLDRVRDGLVTDPRACHFDPAVLACRGADGPACLTPPQVAALAKIYAGPRDPRTGAQITPGAAAGTEAAPGTWAPWIVAAAPDSTLQFMFGTSYYAHAVFENRAWDYRTLNFDADVALGDAKAGLVLNATSPDLRTFRARGGKLLQFHGWGDAAIPGQSSIDYYERVRAFLATYPDALATARRPVEDFYRLFMVPGLSHCLGGVGPHDIGLFDFRVVAVRDPERDVLAALERWVEQGVAPARLVGTGTAPADPSKTLTRPLCPHPKVARYDGRGDPNDAASFACAAD